MIRLRRLEVKDAPLMLEWMHDPEVVKNMQTDFVSKTIEDCVIFVENAAKSKTDIHLAIVENDDEYLGTVSLKHIADNEAEFAITIRRKAMGKGISKAAMAEIIQYGFEELHLNKIYWCVNPNNQRAVKFYNKNGYQRICTPQYVIGYTSEQTKFFWWYAIEADRYESPSKNK